MMLFVNKPVSELSSSEVKHFVQYILHLHYIRISMVFLSERLLRIIEHAGAEAHPAVIPLKDIVVPATFATSPELFIVREFRESHGFVTHPRVEFHYREGSRDGEKFGKRKSKSSQLESFRLDGAGKAKMAVFWVDNQTGCRDKISMTPALNVAEPHEPVSVKSYHAFTAADFCGDLFGAALRNACSSLQG